MKTAVNFLLAIVLIVGSIGTAGWMTTAPIPGPDTIPIPATAKSLAGDPSFYSGRRVRLDVRPFMVDPGRMEMVYRPIVPGPATITCRFKEPFTQEVPRFVTGVCVGKADDGSVLVIHCQAASSP